MIQLAELGIEMVRAQIKFLIVCFFIEVIISFQDRLDLQQKHFAVEGFGDVVVCAEFISLNDVFLHSFGTQEKKRNVGIYIPDLFSKRESIHMGHHHVQQAKVNMFPLKSGQSKSSVPLQGY